MVRRVVGSVSLGAFLGTVFGMMAAIPALCLAGDWPFLTMTAVAGVAGLLAGVLAAADPGGKLYFGGQWVGVAVGALTISGFVGYAVVTGGLRLTPPPNPVTAAVILVITLYADAVGFFAGRLAEFAARDYFGPNWYHTNCLMGSAPSTPTSFWSRPP